MDKPNETLFDKAASLLEASAKFIASGYQQVSEQVRNERFDICKQCEFYSEKSGISICNHCGCVLNLKTRFPKEHCPISKW